MDTDNTIRPGSNCLGAGMSWIVLKTKGEAQDYCPTKEKIQEWEKAYPLVPIEAELLMMQQHLETNPQRRPIRMPKFVTNWLKKEQREALRLDRNRVPEPVWEIETRELRSEEEQQEWRDKDNIDERIRRLRK